MEKRVLLAALLSSIFLVLYSSLMMRASGSRKSAAAPPAEIDSLPQQQQLSPRSSSQPHLLENEEVASIESSLIALEIGASSGAVRRATLKSFLDEEKKQPLSFGGTFPLAHLQIGSAEGASWRLLESTSSSLAFEVSDNQNNSYHILYSLDDNNPLLRIQLQQINGYDMLSNGMLGISNGWQKGDNLSNRYNSLELFILQDNRNGKKYVRHQVSGRKQLTNVPRGTRILSITERYFCQSIKPIGGNLSVSLLPELDGTALATSVVHFESSSQPSTNLLEVYFGPRDYFYLKRAGFEEAFPIGTIGQIGLILLMILSWMAKLTTNYGLAIILFSVAVTCAMAPFTMMGFKSMKRMQELKPEVDRILAAHKDDPKRANQQVVALYKAHRVSPLGGCLPMLLQMPIFIALFNAMSHYVELRGVPFLWISDLSLPDRVARLPVSVPFLGNDLNLLPIIMAVAMYLQTKMSQRGMPSGQGGTSSAMMSSPLMSVIFGVMFYQFPSGLVLYWLTNSLVSLAWYRLIK